MRMLRFRVRTLMIAVIVVGSLLGSFAWLVRLEQRSEHLRQLAERHAKLAKSSYARVYRRINGGLGHHDFPTPQSKYHESLADKYERAARYPWLPVAPDPPEPK